MKRVIFYVFEGFELLDMAGPACVFGMVNTITQKTHYETVAISVEGGAIHSSSGLKTLTQALDEVSIGPTDTLLVMGAEREALRTVMTCNATQAWLRAVTPLCQIWGSVCAGTFILAVAGLLDGHRVTTHWQGAEILAKAYPNVILDADALYVTDDRLWTSAGVATGIDMALAMVAQALGSDLMLRVAKRMVVYAHRLGHQSQFSQVLRAQTLVKGRFSGLIDWIEQNLSLSLRVEDMARFMAMSERSFYRKFTKALGVTPTQYVIRARLERAKAYFEAGQTLKSVVTTTGFRSEAGFRNAFEARFGVSPSLYRQMHAR
jgi:transcriptional regulator GlxA family with amidase domain